MYEVAVIIVPVGAHFDDEPLSIISTPGLGLIHCAEAPSASPSSSAHGTWPFSRADSLRVHGADALYRNGLVIEPPERLYRVEK